MKDGHIFSDIVARCEAGDEAGQPDGCQDEDFFDGVVTRQRLRFFREEAGHVVLESCFHYDICFLVDVAKISPLR